MVRFQVEESWGGAGGEEMATDWANEPAPGLPAVAAAPGRPPMHPVVNDDWSAQPAQTSDWAAETAAPAPGNEWGGSSNWN